MLTRTPLPVWGDGKNADVYTWVLHLAHVVLAVSALLHLQPLHKGRQAAGRSF